MSAICQNTDNASTNNRYPIYISGSIGFCSLLFLFFRYSSKRQVQGKRIIPTFQVVKGRQLMNNDGSDQAFEDYVASLFDPLRFRINRIEQDKATANNLFDQSHKYPDIEIEYLSEVVEGDKFAIECKWCPDLYTRENIRGIHWADHIQIKNYCQYERREKIPVWIAVGLEGTPAKPAHIFLARLTELKDSFIPETQLERFKITKLSSKFSYNPYTKRVINQ
jgi:hypothetical protein